MRSLRESAVRILLKKLPESDVDQTLEKHMASGKWDGAGSSFVEAN